MNKTPRLGLWWPLVFGTAIGVETMLSALVLFGPARAEPEVASQLTSRGLSCFRPEYDMAIYAGGCVLATLLVGGFSWLWQRRAAHVSDDAHDNFIRQGCAQLSVAVALFLLHVGLVALVRYSGIGYGFALRHYFGLESRPLPVFAVCVLAAPTIVSLVISTIGSSWNLGIAPRQFVRLLTTPPALRDFPKPSFNGWFDILVPLLLCAVIYIPAWQNLAGQICFREEFHHWDFFAMGPALAFHHGKALVTDAYAPYGVGWPVLFSTLSGLIPITYGRFLQAAVVYGCVYFIGIYVFLRLVLGRAVWAAAGVFFALSLQTFHGLDSGVIWSWPSSTVLRMAMDVWFFIALLLHLRTGCTTWATVAGALVGLAILFETDTGIYTTIVFAAYWVFAAGIRREPQLLILRPLRQAVIAFVTTALVLLTGLAVASRGTLWRNEFWAGWLEPLRSFSGGVNMIPIAIVQDGTLLLFTGMVAVFLGAVAMAVIKLLRRESTPADVLIGCLASYGLLVLIIFVGRSHPFNIFHPSVPFALVVTLMAARLHQGLQNVGAAHREGDRRAVCNYLESLSPWCALGSVVIWLLANPVFQNYPGMLRTLFSRAPEEGLCLLREPRDICGLPAVREGFVRDFDVTVSSLRTRVAAGQTVAVLDDVDTIFYLAAAAPPWWRYSPCFPAIMRRSELEALQRAIVSRGPQCILIRSDGRHAQTFQEEDVWRAVHETVASCYRIEGAAGVFEIWKRNAE